MRRKLLVMGLLAFTLTLVAPTPTYACSGISWLIGICVDEINQDVQVGMTERAEIASDKEKRIAEVQSAANVQIEQARQQIELFKAQDAADERRHQAELERMEQQFDAYVTLVQAQTQERVATILGDYSTAQVALQEQSDIAVAGINGTTNVVRTREIVRGAMLIVLMILATVLVIVFRGRLRGTKQ